MGIEELGLTIGDAIQLQIGENTEQRYAVRFYGANPHGGIITSAPHTKYGKMIFAKEDQLVTLRFVAKNVASGFSSRVMETRAKPYPHLHIEIPKSIQTVEVRKEVRVDTSISATVINKTHKSPALSGKLLNMSCSGALIETNMKIAHKENILNMTMKLPIEEIECLVTMDCKVTYLKEDEEEKKYCYGINIENIDEEDMVTLRAFIYQELLRNLHMI